MKTMKEVLDELNFDHDAVLSIYKTDVYPTEDLEKDSEPSPLPKPLCGDVVLTILNDDKTPFTIVVDVQISCLDITIEEAVRNTIKSHYIGEYPVAVLPKEQARAVVDLIEAVMHKIGFPLKVRMDEPA